VLGPEGAARPRSVSASIRLVAAAIGFATSAALDAIAAEPNAPNSRG
jgi:hypothetical protein